MLERHELDVFLTPAEELHFGRTAERLRVSTARVSQTVQRLERRIGVPLFNRTSRPAPEVGSAVAHRQRDRPGAGVQPGGPGHRLSPQAAHGDGRRWGTTAGRPFLRSAARPFGRATYFLAATA